MATRKRKKQVSELERLQSILQEMVDALVEYYEEKFSITFHALANTVANIKAKHKKQNNDNPEPEKEMQDIINVIHEHNALIGTSIVISNALPIFEALSEQLGEEYVSNNIESLYRTITDMLVNKLNSDKYIKIYLALFNIADRPTNKSLLENLIQSLLGIIKFEEVDHGNDDDNGIDELPF